MTMPAKSSICSGFPIATFDYQRVLILYSCDHHRNEHIVTGYAKMSDTCHKPGMWHKFINSSAEPDINFLAGGFKAIQKIFVISTNHSFCMVEKRFQKFELELPKPFLPWFRSKKTPRHPRESHAQRPDSAQSSIFWGSRRDPRDSRWKTPKPIESLGIWTETLQFQYWT